ETRAEAVAQLAEARNLMTDVEKSVTATLAKFPKRLDPKTESDKIDQQRALREELSEVRLLRALTLQQQAQAYGEKADEFKKLHEQAANEFQELYDKYNNYLVGFYARVYQGQCFLDLGKLKEASGCFEDIVLQGG